MFEALSDKLKKVLKDLRGQGRLSEAHIEAAMREIRIALLEADVNFKVVKSQTYDADAVDMAAVLTPVVPGKLGLNLITCTGQLDETGHHYEERLVVFATAE